VVILAYGLEGMHVHRVQMDRHSSNVYTHDRYSAYTRVRTYTRTRTNIRLHTVYAAYRLK
jgi:hypothetical protein